MTLKSVRPCIGPFLISAFFMVGADPLGFVMSGDQPDIHALWTKYQSTLEERFASLENELAAQRDKHEEELASMKAENAELSRDLAELELRVEYLEAITRKHVPRTCNDLKNVGVTKSGSYLIDPDGPTVGDPPFSAFCDLAAGEYGITVVDHDTRGQTDVDHCQDAGCHSSIVTYQASEKQIKALISQSEGCSQEIRYHCFAAPMEVHGNSQMAWWVGENGSPNYYWNGDHDPSVHRCSCGEDHSCTRGEVYACNCDSGAPEWLLDAGTLTDVNMLPVKELRFGGITSSGQAAKFELGPLECHGRKPVVATESCATLLQSGHVAPGYYLLDGPGGLNYHLATCNMDLDPTDAAFQLDLPVAFAEYPVAFDLRTTNDHFGTGVVDFDEIVLNDGNAATLNGVFTAPLDGVYAFSFFCLSRNDLTTHMQLRVDGAAVATFQYTHITGLSENENMGDSTIAFLRKGQLVDVFVLDGTGFTAEPLYDAHFTGQLLYPVLNGPQQRQSPY